MEAAIDLLHHAIISDKEISISGLSAGGFMAVQLHVAHSALFKGIGIFAAGPYFCSRGEKKIADSCCTQTEEGGPDIACSVNETITLSTEGRIDKISNLCDSRVFIQSGNNDIIVRQEVAKELENYYNYFVKKNNIKAVYTLDSNHCLPTDKNHEKLIPCEECGSPFIGMCSYDGAGEALKHIYETSHAPLNNPGPANGRLVKFSQKEFWGKSKNMHKYGYIYIPSQIDSQKQLKLHVVLHGCLQNIDFLNTDFIELAGYNEWAENNNMIILYPQVANIPKLNTAACWDWWGYEGNDFHTKNGPQIQAITAMITRLVMGSRMKSAL